MHVGGHDMNRSAVVFAVQKSSELEKLLDEVLVLLTSTPPENRTKEELVQLIEEVVGDIEEKKLELGKW